MVDSFPSPPLGVQVPYYYNNIPVPPSRTNLEDGFNNLDSKVSPSLLIIIVTLAVIFFICGLLHLLVRFLLRPSAYRSQDDDILDSVTALQGQLQQLFHLHDAGVDQSFIDTTLPVFHYKDIIVGFGSNDKDKGSNPFDCAVCLCEFEPEDKLRLLPKCSHAFHMECIDTWLLSHSTCPLCRASLIPDVSSQGGSGANVCSPVVFVLESGSERLSREINVSGGGEEGCNSEVQGLHRVRRDDIELGSSGIDSGDARVGSGEKVVAVKLGKFRNVDDHHPGPAGEGISNSTTTEENCVARRCYSMGHFEYVMDENSLLRVPIRSTPAAKKPRNLPLNHGQRPAMSECGCDSRREFNGFEGFGSFGANSRAVSGIGDAIGRSSSSKRRENYSISKIWLRGKKEMMQSSSTEGGCGSSSRRAFSFRFPMNCNNLSNNGDELREKIVGNGGKRRSNSEAGIGSSSALDSGLANPVSARISGSFYQDAGIESESASEFCFDEEISGPGCNSIMDLESKTPSFARRTLLWLVGRQSKVGNSQCTTDNC